MKGDCVMSFLKKSVSVILMLALIFTTSVAVLAATGEDNDIDFGDLGNVLYGDVNDDGVIDIFDLIALAKSVVSGDYSECNETKADMNTDTAIDIFDLIALAKKIVA